MSFQQCPADTKTAFVLVSAVTSLAAAPEALQRSDVSRSEIALQPALGQSGLRIAALGRHPCHGSWTVVFGVRRSAPCKPPDCRGLARCISARHSPSEQAGSRSFEPPRHAVTPVDAGIGSSAAYSGTVFSLRIIRRRLERAAARSSSASARRSSNSAFSWTKVSRSPMSALF